MSFLATLRDKILGRQADPTEPRRRPVPPPKRTASELPPFSIETADLMRFDPQIRIGLGARNGLLMPARAMATSSDTRIASFVQATWDNVWSAAAHVLLRAKLYGFIPLEVKYRLEQSGEFAGALVFDRLQDHHPRNVRILLQGDDIAGFQLNPNTKDARNVPAPLGLVCTFDSEFGNPYGSSLLERAHSPWFEKWMHGGAKKLLRLRMLKDAYIGDIFWYPPERQLLLANGDAMSWRDVAREMAEARQSGGAMTLPMMYDRDGRKLVDYTPPQDVGAATGIFEWSRALDYEIWKALELPPEVIEAARVGSGWSGRSVPLIVALSAVQLEYAELVRCVDRDVLRPLVELNFGAGLNYELRPTPLLDSYLDQIPMPGGLHSS
jgi:hypothetical protein